MHEHFNGYDEIALLISSWGYYILTWLQIDFRLKKCAFSTAHTVCIYYFFISPFPLHYPEYALQHVYSNFLLEMSTLNKTQP